MATDPIRQKEKKNVQFRTVWKENNYTVSQERWRTFFRKGKYSKGDQYEGGWGSLELG